MDRSDQQHTTLDDSVHLTAAENLASIVGAIWKVAVTADLTW